MIEKIKKLFERSDKEKKETADTEPFATTTPEGSSQRLDSDRNSTNLRRGSQFGFGLAFVTMLTAFVMLLIDRTSTIPPLGISPKMFVWITMGLFICAALIFGLAAYAKNLLSQLPASEPYMTLDDLVPATDLNPGSVYAATPELINAGPSSRRAEDAPHENPPSSSGNQTLAAASQELPLSTIPAEQQPPPLAAPGTKAGSLFQQSTTPGVLGEEDGVLGEEDDEEENEEEESQTVTVGQTVKH